MNTLSARPFEGEAGESRITVTATNPDGKSYTTWFIAKLQGKSTIPVPVIPYFSRTLFYPLRGETMKLNSHWD
jgi:hypothetical protein